MLSFHSLLFVFLPVFALLRHRSHPFLPYRHRPHPRVAAVDAADFFGIFGFFPSSRRLLPPALVYLVVLADFQRGGF
jgi:hypothetical protein